MGPNPIVNGTGTEGTATDRSVLGHAERELDRLQNHAAAPAEAGVAVTERSDAMSVADNKDKVRRWFAETVRGGTDRQTLLAVAEETIAPEWVDHDGPDPAHSRAALLRVLPGLLRAFPDLRFTVEQLVGEGELVAVRLRGEATHTGEVPGHAPTGTPITWTENEIYRFADGRMVESWGEGTLDEALAAVGFAFKKA